MSVVNPVMLAALHQRSIADKRAQIQAEIACIRQLLITRKLRRKGQISVSYTVTEVKVNLSGIALVRGKLNGEGRTKLVGTIAEIEIVPMEELS